MIQENIVWKIKKTKDLKNYSGNYGEVIAKLLALRGLTDEKDIQNFFSPDYEKGLKSVSKNQEMKKAVERIATAHQKQEKIAIFGDYDADGVTSAALLFETLQKLGFAEVICYIPDRQTEGYGLNEKALDYLFQKKVRLIITVDCGTSNAKEVKKIIKSGIDIVITDHHSIPDVLPEAVAVINPHLPSCGFPFPDLAGVGVAFKLAEALYEKMAPEKVNQLKWLLDLVAIGTIADCVPLLGENRVLVKYGLVVLSKTRRTGLRELFKTGRIDITEDKVPSAEKVAFQVAPRINAAGRMDHANVSYKLLLEKDPVLARDMALELESKNQERQKVTGEIFREVKILGENSFKEKKFIFAASPHWPVGILGLVAGKITETFQKPSIILQKKEDVWVGSLRSISKVNIFQNLKKCSDLLVRFGGHSQAAGVTLLSENADKFFAKMSCLIEEELSGKEIIPSLDIDAEISTEDIDWEFMINLKKMEPFGMGNAQPVFCLKNMVVADARIVGNGQKHWKLSLRGESGAPKVFDAIGFSLVEKFPNIKINDRIDLVATLEEDEWNGNKKIQLKVLDIRKKNGHI